MSGLNAELCQTCTIGVGLYQSRACHTLGDKGDCWQLETTKEPQYIVTYPLHLQSTNLLIVDLASRRQAFFFALLLLLPECDAA